MTLDEIDRLYNRIEKVFDLISELRKLLSECQGEVKSHLDSSIVRVKGYDDCLNSIKVTMTDLERRIKYLEGYIGDLESKKKGVETIGTMLKWAVGTLAGLITIYAFWGGK